ncbi:MAG: DUF1801 domain-containing protein [Bacteroidetes bacterium]|nr:DUF1801 domain-containing protein [Bacteroidota bacterium]
MNNQNLNPEVTSFLDSSEHPLRTLIERLREIILNADTRLNENVKWNNPNYHVGEKDLITMRTYPPRQIQLVFHRGTQKLEVPKKPLIQDDSGILDWKTNDRAVATFSKESELEKSEKVLADLVKRWVDVVA